MGVDLDEKGSGKKLGRVEGYASRKKENSYIWGWFVNPALESQRITASSKSAYAYSDFQVCQGLMKPYLKRKTSKTFLFCSLNITPEPDQGP